MIDFTQIINQHQDGQLLIELNATTAKLVEDCISTGKKGAITLTLQMESVPIARGGHQMRISPNLTSKNPRFDSGVGFLHVVTDQNDKPVGLEREQMALYDFNAPDTERKEVK